MNKHELKKRGKDAFRKTLSSAPTPLKRFLTAKEIGRLTSPLLSPDELTICERQPERRKEILSEHKKNNPKAVRSLEKKIHSVIADPGFALDEEKASALRDDMEYAWYAYGFQPKEFVYFHLEDKDIRTFVSDTERQCIKHAMNDFTQSVFADKAKVYRYFKEWYKRDAAVIESKKDFDRFEAFVRKHPTFVVKIVNSSMGKGVWLQESSEDHRRDFSEIIRHGKVLLEERIVQKEEMGQFNASSINTVRVSTYLTRDGVIPGHGFMRTGRAGSFVDNGGSGGIFSLVDVKAGAVISDGSDEYGNTYAKHPDTGIAYKGFAFPDWEEALKICTEASPLFPEMKYKSFDLAYSAKGWAVVEINPSGELLQQACMAVGEKENIRQILDRMDLICPYTFR